VKGSNRHTSYYKDEYVNVQNWMTIKKNKIYLPLWFHSSLTGSTSIDIYGLGSDCVCRLLVMSKFSQIVSKETIRKMKNDLSFNLRFKIGSRENGLFTVEE